ncbi:hypothetical protein ACFYXV_02240 [Streptomyces sp. NPDC002181]|uniref:hypothetical protein n=1 Tax=Streptomyces sp. NPDC002181 TaxID=3364635 RepID=UPI0036CF48F1
MYRRRPNPVARTLPILAALALSQVIGAGGGVAQAAAPPARGPSAAAAPTFTCLTKADPYWDGCRAGYAAGWPVGLKCKPKPSLDYGDPQNRYRHGYVDGYGEAYDAALKQSKCPPLVPVPANPVPPAQPPPAQPPPAPREDAQQAREIRRFNAVKAACVAKAPAGATAEAQQQFVAVCLKEAGYPNGLPFKEGDAADAVPH